MYCNKVQISLDFHAQQSLEFTHDGVKKKTSNEQKFCGWKSLVDERERSEENSQMGFELMSSQYTLQVPLVTTMVRRNACQKAHCVEPGGGRATRAEDQWHQIQTTEEKNKTMPCLQFKTKIKLFPVLWFDMN